MLTITSLKITENSNKIPTVTAIIMVFLVLKHIECFFIIFQLVTTPRLWAESQRVKSVRNYF